MNWCWLAHRWSPWERGWFYNAKGRFMGSRRRTCTRCPKVQYGSNTFGG